MLERKAVAPATGRPARAFWCTRGVVCPMKDGGKGLVRRLRRAVLLFGCLGGLLRRGRWQGQSLTVLLVPGAAASSRGAPKFVAWYRADR